MYSKLISAAKEVRGGLEHSKIGLQRFPFSCCNLASHLLGKYLVEEIGVSPVEGVANGTRYVPKPNHDLPVAESHFWIEHSKYIIDITADQFNDQQESVIVTDIRNWHGQFKNQTRLKQSELLDLNDYLLKKYNLLLNLLSRNRE